MLLCGWWERQKRWERQICFCALRFRSIEAYHSRVDALAKDGMLYKNMHEAIDGDQIVEVFFPTKRGRGEGNRFVLYLQQALHVGVHGNL